MSVFDIFRQLDEKKASAASVGAVEYIICGLGNPGTKYENTRHNTGFMAVDTIARNCGAELKRLKFKSLTGEATVGGRHCLLMKPTTFMNNSGEAVTEAMSFYKIEPEKVIIIFDDITLDVGKLRIRAKGSDGGHNGMKSIIYLSGSDQFPRIRSGIGAKPHPEYDLADWVLSCFTKEEAPALETAMNNAAAAAELIIEGKISEAMNRFN